MIQYCVYITRLVDEVEELRAHLHADGAAADDDEGEHLANALLGDAREAGGLELLHDAGAELDGVGEVLEKEAVLLHSGGVEGVGLHADAEDEVVVGHLEGLWALDLGFAEDGFAVEINTGDLGVAKFDIGVHLSDRVRDRSIFNCADCCRCKHRSEDEVAARRYADGVKLVGVNCAAK
jgi:hypothetical protein